MSNNAAPKPFHESWEHWEGDTKIIIGVVIGTTESSVSFALLLKDANQTIHRVTGWPGQELRHQSKIPTLVWYNDARQAVSFGAEALLPETEDRAEDDGWSLAKHFKLHLHPYDLQAKYNIKLDSLPSGVSLQQLYTDFMKYLFEHTRRFFEDRVVSGKETWERYSPAMEVVITYPNGWAAREEAFLRSAAVSAGLLTSDQASSKVHFVTEAEASVHFCLHHTNLGNVLQPGVNVAVCDAGNSTVGTTLYSVISTHPVLKLKERASACAQAGTLFVDFEVERFLRKTLTDAGLCPVDVEDYTKAGVKDFQNSVKRIFSDETANQSIIIANSLFHNPSINVRRGRMTIAGSIVKGFFNQCVEAIIASVDRLLNGLSAQHILLIGEFLDIPYVIKVLQKHYEPRGCRLSRPNDYFRLADGAVWWGIMSTAHRLKQRTPRSSWGIETSVAFSDDDPDHRYRKSKSSASGKTIIPGRWHGLVRKGIAIDEDAIVRVPITLDFPPSSSELGEFKLDLYHYSEDDEPVWMRDKQGGLLPQFCKAVHVYTDLKDLRRALRSRIARDGILQCQLNFDICMRFGGIELVAYPEWEEEGTIQTGSCTLRPIIDEA